MQGTTPATGKKVPNALDEALEGLPVRIVDAFNLWPSLCIAQAIPLGRLEWIWSTRGSANRESSLTAKAVFRLLDPQELSEPPHSSRANEWFRKAYVHLLLVPIDELLSQRESPAWQYVRKFVEQCREKRFEYIVAVVADSETVKQNRKLMERVRADVNLARRERVVNVPALTLNHNQKLISHLYHSPPHQELLIRLRECTRDAVEVRVQQYEGELERLYPKRANPDWSFCYFFSVKEAMGFVFCQLGRRDIALRLLDELHAFMVEYDEKEGTRAFCNEPPCVAAKNASDISAKDYQKLFAENTITEMEMRTYLFARQTEIMLPDRKFSDIAERGLKLITAVSRRCIEEAAKNNNRSFSCFRDAWVFTAARNLASTLSPAIPSNVPDSTNMTPQLTTPKERHTARLIAGFHVHALKSFVGLAKVILPGTMVVVKEGDEIITDAQKREILKQLNKELCDALASSSRAEVMYSEIANAAASLYEMGGRSRGAAALDGDAGVIRLRNGSLNDAEKLLNAQCSRFADDYSWDDLHLEKRKELARAEKRLNKIQEYLVSCLTILFMTRASRKISSHSTQTDAQRTDEAELASKWAKEAYETACRLPRVMKYKAEKLFSVSMRHDIGNWFEGDPGKAIVVIRSDIPADIRIDSLFVEFRSAQQPSSPEKKLTTDGKKEKEPTSSCSLKSKTLTMKSKPVKILVHRGTNEIPVFSSEIPWPGRYSANLVALFIGKLKLVQIAPKPDSYPLVGMKGATTQKEALSKVANSTQQPDIGKPFVRFPAFFAEPRAIPASLNIVHDDTLFLVQGALQSVSVNVKSDIYGIDKGSTMSINFAFTDELLQETKNEADEDTKTPVIEVMAVYATESGEETSSVLFACERKGRTSVEVTLNQSVKEGSTISAKLTITLPAKICSAGIESKAIDCSVSAELKGKELSGSAKRDFMCSSKKSFSFINPLLFDSRVDLRAKSVVPTPALQMNEPDSTEGGLLLCTVRSRTPENRKITLQKAGLVLPHWLKLREDEAAAHEELLPFSIYEHTRFIFAFDVLVCGAPVLQDDIAGSNFIPRRYSRRSTDRVDFEKLKHDLGSGSSPQRITGLANTSDTESTGLDSSRSTDLEMAIQRDNGFSPMEGITEDIEMTHEDEEMKPIEEELKSPKSPDAPEIGEVVDLSGGANSSTEKTKFLRSSAEYKEECSGTLRLEFGIDGVEGIAFVERAVRLHQFRPQRRTFRIERMCLQTIEAGESVEFGFCIAMTKNPNFVDGSGGAGDELELQYEIDADANDWIVSGMKRGVVGIMDGKSQLQKITLLPLTVGRVLMPIVRLFTVDGRAMPESSFENMNENMQVIVLPSTHVTSVCVEKSGDVAESAVRLASVASGAGAQDCAKDDVPKAHHMPEVVAFESFFDL